MPEGVLGNISLVELFRRLLRKDLETRPVIDSDWHVVGKRKSLAKGWNPTMLSGVSALKSGEVSITGDEAKRRLGSKDLLGVEAFWSCWNDRLNIPVALKGKIILFDGDELRSPRGAQYSLYLYWGGIEWDWYYCELGDTRMADAFSAIAR